MRSVFLILFAALILTSSVVQAGGQSLFKKYNPDIDKYDFAKNFIISIGYYKRVADRLKVEGELKAKTKGDLNLITKYINNCTLDNTDIRIARNMLTRFLTSKNGLIVKVSLQATEAYDQYVALSVKERELWQKFYQHKASGRPDNFDEALFVRQQMDLVAEKKEAEKKLLEASMLIRKVLLSAALCDSDDCSRLVLTKTDRQKLLNFLDVYARDNTQWGIKAGQTPVEGCVASIREVLEDPMFISKNQ